MTIAYKSQGAGAGTETNGAALNLACPATVDENDILIAHVIHTGTTTEPTTPADWSLLYGPANVGTTATARHWVFGKLAAGTEDGASIGFGTDGGTNGRAGRIYSFSGWVSGTLADVVPAASFSDIPHATDPQGPSVTTTVAGALAVALTCQDDNNTEEAIAGASGGTWGGFVTYVDANWGPQGLHLDIQVATPTADPGTISGGATAAANDEAGTIGFEIRPSAVAGVDATLSATIPAVTSAATAEADVDATLAATVPPVTSSSTATIEDPSVDATLAATIPPVTAAATAEAEIDATASPTVPPVTAAGSAEVDVDATASPTIGAVTAVAAAEIDVEAAATPTVGAVTAAAAAEIDVEATAGPTVGAVSLAATATIEADGISAELAVTIPPVTAAGAAEVDIEATASAPIGSVGVAAAATIDVDATASAAVPPVTVAATATIADPSIDLDVAAVIGPVTAVATAEVTGTGQAVPVRKSIGIRWRGHFVRRIRRL